MRFSQRIGKTPIKTILQIESIDDDLKNILWNTIIDIFKLDDNGGYKHNDLSNHIWATFFKQTKDRMPNNGYYEWFANWFFEKAKWYEIYDFIEYLCCHYRDFHRNDRLVSYIKQYNKDILSIFNSVLEKELAGYRIIEGQISPITDKVELSSIMEAIDNSNKWKSVNIHLKTAIDYFSDRKNPDYRNSIKESISAVESCCGIISNKDKATLGETLLIIEKTHGLHGALKSAFSALYGYTSNSGGIRHALTENNVSVTFDDAKFILVSCSAFINYLRAKIKM
jgi:hypothetical protein